MNGAGDEQSPEAYWGTRAAEYDEFIVRVVPRYHEMMERLVDYAPATAAHVLELGTGTGTLSLRMAARWPDARFTFVDGAPEMLEVTRERLRLHAPHVAAHADFRAARFEELHLETNTFDVVAASLSLHHVVDIEPIYHLIAPTLVSGGRLLMIDGIRGETAATHAAHMSRWAASWDTSLSMDEIEEVTAHVAQQDHYRSLGEPGDMLRRAGFEHVVCVWRDGLFAVLTAVRT
ncbi:MAG TPA: class I SAM-dependent methyltransferase [Longimicrobiales bacterium]|nr:class I SAM-dependent methyltransferase [Longimicrobiales bacterium]